MRAINLIPKDAVRTRRLDRKLVGGAAAAVSITALLGAGYVNVHADAKDNRATLDALRAELASIPVKAVKPDASAALALEKGQRVTALSAALSGRFAWDRLFRELSGVLPEDVWLTGLTAKAPVVIVPAPIDVGIVPETAANGFTIQGYTYSQDGVARLLARLATVPDFAAVELQTSAIQKLHGQAVVGFSISASIRPSGATS